MRCRRSHCRRQPSFPSPLYHGSDSVGNRQSSIPSIPFSRSGNAWKGSLGKSMVQCASVQHSWYGQESILDSAPPYPGHFSLVRFRRPASSAARSSSVAASRAPSRRSVRQARKAPGKHPAAACSVGSSSASGLTATRKHPAACARRTSARR